MAVQHAHRLVLTLLTGVAALTVLGAPPIVLLILPALAACAILAIVLRDPHLARSPAIEADIDGREHPEPLLDGVGGGKA
ncbi:hypothetical protein [Nocardia iowensis]|uniref:Uncharacterized protein n=1 Tax=Nocardia iowensis TaxID=204891 RepID=A0ABX8RM31_NOCIO|nr:hypothetical protein [Nocardia iowensis]QXN90678.1 hypothetical protein KV110_35720 [Nocardia iowensis]